MTTSIDLNTLVHEIGPDFAARAAESDANDAFVAENYETLKTRKVFSALVPADLGGGGAKHSEMCAFVRHLAGYCPSTALALSMHQHLTAAAVFNYLNDRPGWKVLEKVAGGDLVLVSTGANDWLGSNGEVERVEGGFKISAKKPFATGSPAGSVLVTSAPYEDPAEGWQVLHFPVPLNAEGVSFAGDWKAMGMRGTGSQTVILDGVLVPEEAVALRRPRGAYHPAWNVILTVAMPLIMSAYLGVAEAAAEIALGQAARRADDSGTAYLVGEMNNELATCRMAVESMVAITNDWNFEPAVETANDILTRKTIAAKAAIATVEKAMEITGGAGFFRGLGLERLLRDVHGARYHPLPEKAQQSFSGRLAMGLDPIADAKPMEPKASKMAKAIAA